ncbi:MAG: 3-methyladenine DNA glycosylase AlkD [Pseudohongiellaceae bacterium]|jgi:3-methyladenine DNA glycosylase AlkD
MVVNRKRRTLAQPVHAAACSLDTSRQWGSGARSHDLYRLWGLTMRVAGHIRVVTHEPRRTSIPPSPLSWEAGKLAGWQAGRLAALTQERNLVSKAAKKIASELKDEGTKLGDIKKRGKEIKKDHELAMELWETGVFHARLLSTLILDKALLTQAAIDALAADMLQHDQAERNQLADWLLANQLMKSKKTITLLESWEENPSPVLSRLFWYHQARLRWTGQTPPENSGQLLEMIEKKIASAHLDVQWAMNFCAGWIGVHESKFRSRCIGIGEQTGLYKNDPVAKNCTPSYLPDFIRIEAAKREG